MSGELVVWVGGLRATASNRPRALRVSDASKTFLCFERIPVLNTCCKGMVPLVDPFLPRPMRSGEGHRSSACSPRTVRALRGAPCDGLQVAACCLGYGTFGGLGVFAPSMSDSKRFVAKTCTTVMPVAGSLARCLASAKECYLVDPASSHMLVSKIKPCMCKYELIQTVKLRMAH